MAKSDLAVHDQNKRSNAGRKADPRQKLEIRLEQDDYAVLERAGQRVSLTPDELVRVFVHIALWESQDQVLSALEEALNKAR